MKSRPPGLLSVVFSFRNEEEVLSELVNRIRKVLDDERLKGRISGHELIFVNDESTDRSLEILKELSQAHHDIRVVNLSRCFGVTAGVLAGMAFVSGDAVVYMDADLQDPPEVIHEMLDLWCADSNLDIIHTVRRRRKGEGAVKLGLTRVGYAILNRITGLKLPMEVGDFKMVSRRTVSQLLKFKEKRPYLRGLIYWMGFKSAMLPYVREARFAGETKFPVLSPKVISNFTDSALISFSSVPLKIASILGLFAIVVDLFFLIHVFMEKFYFHRAVPGWSAIMVVTLFLGGVQLFCLGIVGLYLNAVFEQSMDRPRYIVQDTMGFPSDFQQRHLE
jgi:dolichol-phosphate mannosyltransferase